MAYSIEIKNEVKEKLGKGEKAKEISEQMGISLPTIYKWKKEFEKQVEQEKEENVREGKVNQDEGTNQEEIRKKIKELTKLKQFDKVLELAEEYPDDPVIQVQAIKIIIKKYEETKEKEVRQKYLERTKNIGKREKLKNNVQIQLQMMKIAIEEGDLEEAKRIGKRKEFENDAQTQLQMMKIAIEEGDLEEAKKIGKREKFIKYLPIQAQMKIIEEKRGRKKTKNSKEQVANISYDGDEVHKKIKELIKLKQFDKVLELAEEYPDDPVIQVQAIKIIIKKYEETKEIEIKEKYLEEAKRIGERAI